MNKGTALQVKLYGPTLQEFDCILGLQSRDKAVILVVKTINFFFEELQQNGV